MSKIPNQSSVLADIDQICTAAYKSISIRSSRDSLYVSPCCTVNPGMLTTGSIDFEKHSLLEQTRTSWTQREVPKDCQWCKNVENQGYPSVKDGMNQEMLRHYELGRLPMPTTWDDIYKPELIRMDYWVGDGCNLACVTCGPENSSLWRQILNYPRSDQRIIRNNFWDKIDMSKLLEIHIHGGEPLLSREHAEFIQIVPNKHLVSLVYNTNGTIRPGQEVLDAWKEYRNVSIHFSFDDIGNRFEYLRWPGRWDQALDTFEFILNNVDSNTYITINMVESMLNSPHLHEIKSWWRLNYPTDKHNHDIQVECTLAGGNWGPTDRARDYWVKILDLRDQQYGQGWRELFPLAIPTVMHD